MNPVVSVILVDDSPIVLNILKRILGSSPEIKILGTASNGQEGLAQVKALNPDVVCTDLLMPVMDGLKFTKEIMKSYPRPILVISSALEGQNEHNVFNLLKAGALDVFPKPAGGTESDYARIREQLVNKIKILKSIPVQKKIIQTPSSEPTSFIKTQNVTRNKKIEYIVIGASTGGPNAIQKLLERLPSNISAPIICVQHISDGFIESLVKWLNDNTKLKVKIMEEGETPLAGTVYFPQDKTHLVIGMDGKLRTSREISHNGHTPCIDITFKSFARYFGENTLGVILTGMGEDGAAGLLSIRHTGGHTIGEDSSTCVVYGMPRVAKEIGAVEFALPLYEIPQKILGLLQAI